MLGPNEFICVFVILEEEEHKHNHDGAEGEVKENNEEGLDLPTRKFHKEEPTSDRVTRAPKGDHESKGPRRFIGDVNKTGKTTSTTTATTTVAAETHKEVSETRMLILEYKETSFFNKFVFVHRPKLLLMTGSPRRTLLLRREKPKKPKRKLPLPFKRNRKL